MGFRVTAPATPPPARRGRLAISSSPSPSRRTSAAPPARERSRTPQTPPSFSHPYPPLYRLRPVISLIVERVISRSNARLISVAVNPDCSRSEEHTSELQSREN